MVQKIFESLVNNLIIIRIAIQLIQTRQKQKESLLEKNAINLSRRNLSQSISLLLLKGLIFLPSANKIDKAKLKRVGRIWEEASPTVVF